MTEAPIPTLFEWAGRMPALDQLTSVFYAKVRSDAMLAPIFAELDARHPHFVAQFIAEVLGGPLEMGLGNSRRTIRRLT